ncbi:MAG TPA: hypothetical protein VMT74_08965 [Gaiellaceae bacterium]|nr:hypothetical protein [Gaiellaceae bacterium]
MKLMDKAKAAAEQAVAKTKEGVEEVQTKRDLSAAFGELGTKTYELVEAGEIDHPKLTELVEKIRTLKAKHAEGDAAPAPEAETTEPAEKTEDAETPA